MSERSGNGGRPVERPAAPEAERGPAERKGVGRVWSAFTARYLRTPQLSLFGAASFLRAAYVVAFLAQCLAAALVGVVVVLLAGGVSGSPSPLLAWTLVVLALAQLPVISFVVTRLGGLKAGKGARRAALSTALMMGVMLASTAWFLSLALATGQAGVPLFALLGMTMLAYAVGFMQIGRLGRVAATEEIEEIEAPEGA